MERIKYFTTDEINKIFKVIKYSDDRHNTRNTAMFYVSYYCALRASEVALLTIEDFNSIKKKIYCRRLKGSLNNTLRIEDKEVLAALKKHLRENTPEHYLFESQELKPISRQMLDNLIRKYCELAEIKDQSKWHFHTLKHSRAVHLAEMGLDIKDVQYWLGHKKVDNTMVYFQFTTSQQEEMYRKMKDYKKKNTR